MGITKISIPISNISDSRPCILKMTKFLPICVNAKTALWRLAGAKQCLHIQTWCSSENYQTKSSIAEMGQKVWLTSHYAPHQYWSASLQNSKLSSQAWCNSKNYQTKSLPATNLGLHHSKTSLQTIQSKAQLKDACDQGLTVKTCCARKNKLLSLDCFCLSKEEVR